MQTVRYMLVGLGNLGRRFCEIVTAKATDLEARYGLRLVLVGAADSRGAAYDAAGLHPATVARLKAEGASVADYPAVGRPGWDARDLVAEIEADLLLEASPVNLHEGGEPGLTCVRLALEKGMHVVTPNKGPLVLAFRELTELAAARGVKLRYDGTVAGGLPALNVGVRDLRGATVRSIQAVPNLVTGYVMDMLAQGIPWEEATTRARAEGVLEADASWDLDGWDAAAKLVILVNAVIGYPARLEDVARSGVQAVSVEALRAAAERGERYRLLARATSSEGACALSVQPTLMTAEHPLGHLGRKQMGVVYETDIYGTIACIIDEPTPIPSAATMLRDLLDIYVEA